MFFFEKKNQKTFATWGTLPARVVPKDERFLLLFFTKADLRYSSWPPRAKFLIIHARNTEITGSARSSAAKFRKYP